VFVVGLSGTPIFFIYTNTYALDAGFLTLFPDKIEVDNFKTITSYSINDITNIADNDALTRDGFLKESNLSN